MAEHKVAALHGAVAGDTRNDRVMGEQLDHLLGYAHAIVQQHYGYSRCQLAHQRRQGRHHLTGLGHHQQTRDLAWLANETALDGNQLGMALQRGEVDPGMQGRTVTIAQQDAGRLTALSQQGGEDATQGAAAQQ